MNKICLVVISSLRYFLCIVFFITLGGVPLVYAVSDTITITAVVSSEDTSTTNTSSGGGVGASGDLSDNKLTIPTSIIFNGFGYAYSEVYLLKDGITIASTFANKNGTFSFSLTDIQKGSYLFSFISKDRDGLRPPLYSVPVVISNNSITTVKNIFLPPTFSTNKEALSPNTQLEISGTTIPHSTAIIFIENGTTQKKYEVIPDEKGYYSISVDIQDLVYGTYQLYAVSKTVLGMTTSSKHINISIGIENTDRSKEMDLPEQMDTNNDGGINLIDFSIIAYWFKKEHPPKTVDINGDGIVNLKDLSILAYYWTE